MLRQIELPGNRDISSLDIPSLVDTYEKNDSNEFYSRDNIEDKVEKNGRSETKVENILGENSLMPADTHLTLGNHGSRNLEDLDIEERNEKKIQMNEIMENYVLYLGAKNTELLLSLFENDGQSATVYSTSNKCKEFPLLCPGPYPANDFYVAVLEDELSSLELETYLLPGANSLSTYTGISEDADSDNYVGFGYTTFILRDVLGTFGGVYVDLFQFSESIDRNGGSIIKIKNVVMFENLQIPILGNP